MVITGKHSSPEISMKTRTIRSISFGAGFREQNITIDFGFTNLKNSQNYLLYSSSAGSPLANLSINKNMYYSHFWL